MNYPKYTWVGNRIDPEDMKKMHKVKKSKKIPITQQVAEAVSLYVNRSG